MIICSFKRLNKKILFNGNLNIGLAGGKSVDKFIHYINKYCKFKNLFFVIDDRGHSLNSKNSNHFQLKNKLSKKFKLIDIQSIWKFNKKLKPLDIIILGMGTDGHIASIFSKMKKENLMFRGSCFKTKKKYGNPYCVRFSFTEKFIIKSKKIILVISSKQKLNLLKKFIFLSDNSIPVVRLISRHNNLDICKVFK